MAERLPDSFDFDKTTRRHEGYPWEEWQDGSAWLILQGEDFEVDLKSMQSQLYLRAKASNMQVRAQLQTDPNRPGIVFRFYPDRPRQPVEPEEEPEQGRYVCMAGAAHDGNGDSDE